MSENQVACPECGLSDVRIVTQALHISEHEIFDMGNYYSAQNSDNSWKTKDDTEVFRCACGNWWPVDKKVLWEWND
jgi:hypothetical protein